MKSKIGLYAIYYKQDKKLHLLTRILATDGETALKNAKSFFKAKLLHLKVTQLLYQPVSLSRFTLKIKNSA